MPVRDGERWLGDAIASLGAQSFADFELLIINDGSTDMTGQIAGEAAQRDPRIRIIALPPSGVVAALNRGLDDARGKYIARLDADDRAQPSRLGRQVDFLSAEPRIGLVGSWADIIDAGGRTIGRLQPEAAPAALARVLAQHNPILHSSVMWRTDLSAAVGRYRAAFEAAEDYDLWLRMSERILIANIPDCLLQYRRHAGAVSRRRKLRQMFSTKLARRAAQVRQTHGVDPADELTAPPDWNETGAEEKFYREDAKLYRFLELSMTDAPCSPGDADFDLSAALAGEFRMTHDERRLAQIALLNIVTADPNMPSHRRMRLLSDFIRLHPARAIQIVGRHLARKYLDRATLRPES
jgi:glycosyltransferase involved in cell wall biosynthesis